MPRAITVTGLSFGDEGKGTIVDALVRRNGVKLVVRSCGGSQAAHNVITPEGVHHTFSTWGAGTLSGAGTLLTKDVLIDPIRLFNEGNVLATKGAGNPFARMAIDENALVITPFHRAVNRIRELVRCKRDRHGSCGIGVGETARYALTHPLSTLRIGDLDRCRRTEDKLRLIRSNLYHLVEAYMGDRFRDGFSEAARVFQNEDLIDALLWRYRGFAQSGLRIVSTDDALARISAQDTVWEGAQGVLLDEDYGFHPYTTWSHVTNRSAREMLDLAGVTDVHHVGVLRCYGHRHGAGPFPTEDEAIRPVVQEAHNDTNEWQGLFRVGWFDLPLARYALKVCPVDSLALTHTDKLVNRPSWPIVTDYGVTASTLLAGDLVKRQEQTEALMRVAPKDRRVTMVANELVPQFIADELDLPLSVTSHGARSDKKAFVLDTPSQPLHS